MFEFLEAAGQNAFIRNALLTGILASVSCGIIGTYVVTKRIASITGAIAHFILGGMGLARYLQIVHGWEALHPLYGAIVSAMLAAVIIGMVTLRGDEREDTIIGALWAVGMGVGLFFISKTPGYNAELMGYLFGNILMVSGRDLWFIAGLDILVAGVTVLFFNQMRAICFDEEFSRLRGIRVELYYILLLMITSLTVVLLVTVVGIVMVIALLTLPAAIAGYFTRSMSGMMILSVVFSVIFTTGGLALSYKPNLPAGATIIILAGIAYFAVMIGSGVIKSLRRRHINGVS